MISSLPFPHYQALLYVESVFTNNEGFGIITTEEGRLRGIASLIRSMPIYQHACLAYDEFVRFV